MASVQAMYGSLVFNDNVMRERLPKETYSALHRTISEGRNLPPEVASVVAGAMKDWAIEKGVTHYTHWFQPMTGVTAEKHDSFLSPIPGGGVIMEFSGKELVRGEPDASSFPSGGLRATFEARGYTAWDPTSYAFIKDGVLCVPTAFCSYGGQALDKKTPLLRSMEAVNKQALRILALFGNTNVRRVTSMAGVEQEYFLVDKKLYDRRKDLQYCGRTLFGAKPSKGQELDDHFFGSIKPRVQAFMRELDEELWKMGVPAKTEHNEAAPAQHEVAVIYATANIATDHNQIVMETLRKVAAKHDLVCLLHEKPFAGVNGSGKHNNWSLATDTGVNLFEPGDTPSENAQFLLFLAAVIKATDEHQDLLRISVSSAANDLRLGGFEAPPAIVSIYIGDELAEVLSSLEAHSAYHGAGKSELSVGVKTLPRIPKDATDRNRTSPFAFTGDKFELRMAGSSMSAAGPNMVLNTMMADTLAQFADRLEAAPDFHQALDKLIVDTITEHKRIIFNGNNYAPEWVDEANRRGLLNLRNAADALACFPTEENVALFERQKVLSRVEILSRYEIYLENYNKILRIEAETMLEMTRRDIAPAVISYMDKLADAVLKFKTFGVQCDMQERMLARLGKLLSAVAQKAEALEGALASVPRDPDAQAQAAHYSRAVVPAMQELRAAADESEKYVSREQWPFPTYGELLNLI